MLPLLLTMTLHLHYVICWPIVCPPSGDLHNGQKGCIPGAVSSLLPTLTYPQWYNRLPMVKLLKVPKVLPDMLLRVWHEYTLIEKINTMKMQQEYTTSI